MTGRPSGGVNAHAWWGLKFEVEFMEARGSVFEQLVRRILELRFPDDFTPVKPAGSEGDWKCDGFLRSQRRFLQIYGPERFEKRRLLDKITGDYKGAARQWPDVFDFWTFVHNSRDGLPPYAIDKLNELSRSSGGQHVCEEWSYPKLRQLVFDLHDGQLTNLLGPPVSGDQVLSTEVDDIIPLLRSIEVTQLASLDKVRPVPSDKLEKNYLSKEAASFLRLGMRRADAVAAYFTGKTMQPMLRDDLAAQFTLKYRSLKDDAIDPDGILFALIDWLTGTTRRPRADAAALAVIAYFFEQCDIYDNPDEI